MSNEFNRTIPGSTYTQVGTIPHLRHPDTGIAMPIMIRPATRDHRGMCEPEIDGQYSLWALPGGFAYVSREPVFVARPPRPPQSQPAPQAIAA